MVYCENPNNFKIDIEVVCENAPCTVKIIGTDKFGRSGKPGELFELYGLTAENIADKVKEAVK